MMEDTQPNEVRLARKGAANIPRVRITRPNRRWQPHDVVEIPLHLPPECQKGAFGSQHARKRWIEDQKYHLRTDRSLSVLSSRCLDHDNRVLFTCRTLKGHDARGNSRTGHLLDQGRSGTPQRARGNHRDTGQLAFSPGISLNSLQGSEPGPSRIRPTPRTFPALGDRSQCLDSRSSILPVEAKFVEPSTTQILQPKPVPRHRTGRHTAPEAESVVDLTLDHPGPLEQEYPARWSTFRSGYVDIPLPAFSSDSGISSPEANTDPPSSIDQKLPHQREDMHDVGSDMNPHMSYSSIRMNDTIHARSTEDRRLPQPQYGTPEAACSSYPRGIEEDTVQHLPNPGFTSACGNLPLSLGSRDKPRRMLHDRDFTYVVTAHGIIDQIDTTNALRLDHRIRSPTLPFEEFVDDACMLSHQGDPVLILGHAREQDQITFLNLERGQVPQRMILRRDWNTAKKAGVSAVTSLISPFRFASGGYDHRVHLWDIAQDLSGASSVELAIKHTSLIHSLLPIVDTSHKLVSVGADRDVPIYDLSAERVAQTLKTSCTPYHAHKTNSQFCTLLEVSHLETQFEIRDHRLPNQAVQRFGFLTEERRGRFEKADSWSHFVVCGDKNGAVRLWDLRNVSAEVIPQPCFDDPIVQVVNIGPRLLACSKRNELACFNFQGE